MAITIDLVFFALTLQVNILGITISPTSYGTKIAKTHNKYLFYGKYFKEIWK